MNTSLFFLALFEIILSIVVTVIVVYISFGILKKLFFKNQEVESSNMAFTIFMSGIIISLGLILSEILPSITNVVRLSVRQQESIDFMTVAKYSGLYLIIGFIMSLFINTAVFVLFSFLTKGVNEFKEIQQNNLAVSIMVVALLLSITLISKDSIALLISSLVPYPEVMNFL
ncbi:MAG: uncharacterized membrane protein YjfL (UPF0719 family) [Planctomycetota bacterium]|jgi:uncharacterized membrane protein YjfL (UPF0719 family)|uniref:DUF350 domain-containing protein n=1 Tax=Patiriisocius sp. Uisw_047 TaxID=3230969 RepID=UPI0039ED47E9